jgi:hypothetical protein
MRYLVSHYFFLLIQLNFAKQGDNFVFLNTISKLLLHIPPKQ